MVTSKLITVEMEWWVLLHFSSCNKQYIIINMQKIAMHAQKSESQSCTPKVHSVRCQFSSSSFFFVQLIQPLFLPSKQIGKHYNSKCFKCQNMFHHPILSNGNFKHMSHLLWQCYDHLHAHPNVWCFFRIWLRFIAIFITRHWV